MKKKARKKVDKQVQVIEAQITTVFNQAQEEIEQKINDFNKRHKVKNDIYLAKLKKGEISEEDYNAWYAGQLFQGQQWNAKRDQICGILHDANTQATKIVNGGTISAFAKGANWTAYKMEHGEGVNFGFGLYNSQAVTRLIKDDPQILPKWKIDQPKEYIWNKQKVNNCVTQGIIQGEGVGDIAKRIATVTSNQNKNLAMTHAQTALGAAQNAGTLQRLQDAKKLGINVVKEWMATLDGRTRDTHREIDGEKQPVGDGTQETKFSNKCRYPGDPLGPAREVFNCRCTLVGDVEDYPEEYQRYDNIEGMPIKNMSYKDWEKAKPVKQRIADKKNRGNVTKETLNKARKAEPKVSKDLKDAVSRGSGHLEGFDYRIKGEGSLSRKIRDKSLKKGMSEVEYSKRITDALRYTNVSSAKNLTDDYNKVTKYLKDHGYTMAEVANTLKDKNAPYRGINTLVKTPDGYTFELQFHTPKSLEVKEINHKLYEEQRLASTTPKRYDELEKIMSDNAKSIPTPFKVETIKDIVKK